MEQGRKPLPVITNKIYTDAAVFRATFKTHDKMTINTYNSNIEIKFEDERATINLYADDYLNVNEKYTAEEEKEGLRNCFDLNENEIEEIIETLLTLEWIEK